ncbi:hypothetical protein SmJEL517_g01935 [Synchytrium microbalum]|uniref:Glycylpeptide N-tetradecanoyltransferase n=1 Tax=Synchytrium microbalum TaxID=1806994 RepID=A0A507CCV3_9FUNG|nr:uncharacterized protein SmJEL517_g01935 [Synchytrium microbalum]TPX35754.1 hypothetical protein SmJEL517_g01935 [Synchytrium microbalum]
MASAAGKEEHDVEDTIQTPAASASASKKKGKKKAATAAATTDSAADDALEASKLIEMIKDGNALQKLVNSGADALKSAGGSSDKTTPGISGVSTKDLAAMDSLLKRFNMTEIMQNLQLDARGRPIIKDMKDHKFWMTQPVPAFDDASKVDGVIEDPKAADEIRKEPYALPKDFEWSTVNVDNDAEIKELYELLSLNYVEDDDNMFRFDYSADFLKWALKPPGWKPQWLIGVRVTSNRKLVAFISGIPATLRVREHSQQLVEINFLCVHKRLRTKRLAPVLIKEVTRRVHTEGIFQAVYTAGVVLPKPIATCRYYHRSLNPKKLIETQFSHLAKNMTMARTIRLYKLPDDPQTPGLRAMTKADVPAVTTLLNTYLTRYKIAPTMSKAEVGHWLLPLPSVVSSFVVEDPGSHKIVEFISFYSLPSTVIGNPIHTHINAAYLFYYVPKEGNSLNLIRDALIMAKKADFDVFNCLDLMQNEVALNELKFGKGDGSLNYYLYNYRAQDMKPQDVGLLLL